MMTNIYSGFSDWTKVLDRVKSLGLVKFNDTWFGEAVLRADGESVIYFRTCFSTSEIKKLMRFRSKK